MAAWGNPARMEPTPCPCGLRAGPPPTRASDHPPPLSVLSGPASYQVDPSSSNYHCGLKVCFPNHSGSSHWGPDARSTQIPGGPSTPDLSGWGVDLTASLAQPGGHLRVLKRGSSSARRRAPQPRRGAAPCGGGSGCAPAFLVENGNGGGAEGRVAGAPRLRVSPAAPRASPVPASRRSRSSRSPVIPSPKASETAIPRTGECPPGERENAGAPLAPLTPARLPPAGPGITGPARCRS